MKKTILGFTFAFFALTATAEVGDVHTIPAFSNKRTVPGPLIKESTLAIYSMNLMDKTTMWEEVEPRDSDSSFTDRRELQEAKAIRVTVTYDEQNPSNVSDGYSPYELTFDLDPAHFSAEEIALIKSNRRRDRAAARALVNLGVEVVPVRRTVVDYSRSTFCDDSFNCEDDIVDTEIDSTDVVVSVTRK